MNTATTIPATAEATAVGQAPAERAFRVRRRSSSGPTARCGTAVLLTVVVLAATGHEVTSFMWGRSAGVLASAAVTYG
ncbi:Integral membrane protein OS=Streptomyces rimosus subsp. rimosus (strain ATCC / DSM 40260 /JCM 4667 / NRRL 2234) OX=1265868 GN=SRIM_034160 PE=4 SV=1 [Streptomyces rimosus subsp. rimosus]